MFDEYGSQRGVDGARIAIGVWSKRPMRDDNPYDVDLTILVIATRSPDAAQAGMAAHLEQSRKFIKASEPEKLSGFLADEALIVRPNASVPRNHYQLQARYGNYFLNLVAALNSEGYFPTEADLMERMRLFDAHVATTLRNAAQPGARADRARSE